MKKPVKVGVIGCGAISGNYLHFSRQLKNIEVTACADLDMERAKAKAKEFAVPRACSVKELLADDEIEIVVNLTIPAAHYSVAMAALKAGKSVYNEKPLAATRAQGKKLIDLARRKKLLVGAAPDTFMGDGIQTCRKLIDDGAIGRPIGVSAFFLTSGRENWHLDPEFFFKKGGGPVFDMGPYYLTVLVNLLGPVKSVGAFTKITFPTRTIGSKPKRGQVITVDTPTHVAAIVNFAGGTVGTMHMSFDVHGGDIPFIEIYGSEGTLSVPDPNGYGGPIRLLRRTRKKAEWREIKLMRGLPVQGRSVGVADMASALRGGPPHRANGELAFHVLDVMESFLDSGRQKKFIGLASTCERPAPVPLRRAAAKKAKPK